MIWVKIIEYDYKGLENLSLRNNVYLAQSDMHQSGSQEVSGSIPNEGTFLLKLFCYSLSKKPLPFLCVTGKVRK